MLPIVYLKKILNALKNLRIHERAVSCHIAKQYLQNQGVSNNHGIDFKKSPSKLKHILKLNRFLD